MSRTRTLHTRTAALFLILAVPFVFAARAEDDPGKIDDLEDRLEKLEVQAARDRIQFTGELRVAVDSIDATQAERFDGLALQKAVVDTLFFAGANMGALPAGPAERNQYIQANYADYLFFQDNLTFDQIQQSLGMFPADQQQMLLGGLLQEPQMYVPERDYSNDIFYTTRLRLNMRADVRKNVSFEGRLGMYKAWGDSTGVQVFNGLPNSFSIDGNTVSVPNSDVVRVERAYFNWKNLGGTPWYLSIGRRPSTFGPPLHVLDNELRQGTPNGHVVDFQFDGITLGYAFRNWLPGNTFRLCYGVGFESGFGSGDQLAAPADRLDDVHLGGINWDLYNTDRMHIQTTVLGAWKVTDGFNGLIVLPVDPTSGNPINAPVVLRFSPSAHLGDIYLADALLERRDGPVHWFVSYAYMESDPTDATTPFGGLFSDPFEVPRKQDGWSLYAGARFDAGASDFLGLEYNHGSEYWFNFTQSADDLAFSKLATRGDVIEGYWLHEFREGLGRARARFRVSAQYYDYDYSGSGFQTGAPHDLNGAMPPVLGFPTYTDLLDVHAELTLKF